MQCISYASNLKGNVSVVASTEIAMLTPVIIVICHPFRLSSHAEIVFLEMLTNSCTSVVTRLSSELLSYTWTV